MVMDHVLVNGDPADNSEIDALRQKCLRLEEENARLRSLLADHGIASEAVAEPTQRPVEPTSNRSKLGTAEKMALFRSLFRGREDVYAQRWESPDGRSGYSPRTERDWHAYNAAKPEERKRVDKETRKNLPLTDEAIHAHLTGKQTLGVYPLLLNETCWFLAVDFDKKTWKDDGISLPFNVPRVVRARGAGALAFGQRCAHLVLFRPACPRRSGTTTRHADPDENDGAASSTRTGFVRSIFP